MVYLVELSQSSYFLAQSSVGRVSFTSTRRDARHFDDEVEAKLAADNLAFILGTSFRAVRWEGAPA